MSVIIRTLLVCVVVGYANTHPHETLTTLLDEYTKGIESLNRVAREIKHEQSISDELELIENSEHTEDPKEYDFIVIGGGSTGAVIANRLSEVPEWNILLLEAGHTESKAGKVPAIAEALQLSEYNWGYKMEPQKHACLGMVEGKCAAPTGKGLGGSSAIDSMLYTRGNSLDYDRWADEYLKSWCYDHILPYFKKSEDAAIDHIDNKYHSKGGPLDVQTVPHHSHLAEAFLEAGHELGANTIDYNGKQQLGFGLTQATTLHGQRMSTGSAFLQPASHRKNLHISPESKVTKILLGDHTHETKGVKYIKDNKLYVAKAKREVILSAGTYNSPQLLMVSGIGAKEQLDHLGIPCSVELPGVGQNLKTHNEYLSLNFIVNDTEVQDSFEDTLKQWLTKGEGLLAVPKHIEALAYIKTKASKEDKDYPDIELQFQTRNFDHEHGEVFKRAASLSDEVYEALWMPLEGHQIVTITPVLLHPKSTGSVTIKSKSALHWPVIHGNHFTDEDEHDLATMVEGIKTAYAVSKSEAFKKYGLHPLDASVPGCSQHEHATDKYWECAIRKLSVPSTPVGTCKMGIKTDKMSVVDEELKVYGVKGLRVADSSIIPFALSAQGTTPAVMIGEKAADMIKTTWT